MDLSPDLSRVSGRDRDPVPAATAPTGIPTWENASPTRTLPSSAPTADEPTDDLTHDPTRDPTDGPTDDPTRHRSSGSSDASVATNPSGTRRVTRRSLRAASAAAEQAERDRSPVEPVDTEVAAAPGAGPSGAPVVPQPSRSTRRSRRAAASSTPPRPVVDVDVVVIGAGQAGLSAAYHLHKAGLVPVGDRGWQDAEATFVVLDDAPAPGGAWQHRPPGMRVADAHGVHDLPGMPLLVPDPTESAAKAVPYYFSQYEEAFGLHVQRPVAVTRVEEEPADEAPAAGRRLVVTSHLVDEPDVEVVWRARGLVNASGTWRKPFWPTYPGRAAFRGRQLHSRDVLDPADLADGHVVVVGGGTSAAQLLLALADVTTTTWVTRRPPTWRDGQLTPELGRAAVALVAERTRAGLPPGSIVSVTGLPLTDAYRAGIASGVLRARPAFSRIVAEGVVWDDPVPPPVPAGEQVDGVLPGLGAWVGGDAHVAARTIVWATGYRPALDHLASLRLRGERGGIVMDGTRVAADPRVHLVGYGPSASTIGANRAGRDAVRDLLGHLALR